MYLKFAVILPRRASRFAARVVSILFLSLVSPLTFAATIEQAFEQAVQSLNAGDFAAKAEAAQRLSRMDHPRVVRVLNAMLEGELQTLRSDKRVVIALKSEGGYRVKDAASGEDLGSVSRRGVRRVAINNSLRSSLRKLIARIGLYSPNPERRLASVVEMFDSMDATSAAMLRVALEEESNVDVRAAIDDALALLDLEKGNQPTQLAAIERLSGNVHASVRSRLVALQKDENAAAEVRASAATALLAIEQKLGIYHFIEIVFFGLSLGSVLVLAAIGLAITFGVMGVINMAHGELIMLGAYTTYVVQLLMPTQLGMSLFVAVPAAFLVAGLMGIAIERGVIRFLYGRPLETLLATFGISLILQQLVRSIFSPLNRSVSTPEWMSGSLEVVAGLSFTYNRLYILAFSLMVFFALWLVLQRTRLGLEVRAVAQNRRMAKAMGVRTGWVDSLTFGLGSGVAGVAGVALSQLTNVGPNLGQSYIVDCFMVVVFGGVGNIWGTLLGGLSLGIANKFIEPFAGAVVAKILILVFIILFIQKRPSGLFPQKGRAAES